MAQLNSLFTGTLLTRTLISSIALGLAFGCGVKTEVLTSNTGGAGNVVATGGAGGGGNTTGTLQCPSATGHVTQLPSGICSGPGNGIGCALVLDASCGPGVNAIPATPPMFNCQCTSGNWNCTVISGGLGLIPCMDAGNPVTGTGGAHFVTTGTGGAIDVPTGGAFNRGTGGAGNATGIFDCTSSTPIPDLSSAQMGDACVSGSSCCVDNQYANDANYGRACVNDHMLAINALNLDSIDHAVDWKPDPSASWSNCEDALANGHSSDTCTWNGGACSRPTSDPCCIDITDCYDYGSGPMLGRKRLCAPGCTNVTPDLSQPVMTACPTSGNFYGPCQFAAPCQGDFVCDSARRLPITDPQVTFIRGTLWCANGVLAGGSYPTSLEH